MKISKIPGLGEYGVFIDDLDVRNTTDEEWMMIGDVHLRSLVTIIRNVDITPAEYQDRMYKWGQPRANEYIRLAQKYKIQLEELPELVSNNVINGIEVNDSDRAYMQNTIDVFAHDLFENNTSIIKVTGKKKEDGQPLGLFAEGELLWHSNESGNLIFSPGVSLLGVEGLVGSSTGFITTADWYQSQTESFKSELDEMILQHEFTPGRINPGLRETQDSILHRNMCPEPVELPLVAQSPGGIIGLHYSVNTIKSIKGMTEKDSQAVFDEINKTLFVDKYIYDHWYENDNDLCLFDNSITLHRRQGGITNRLALRIQYVYDKIADPDWCPWLSEPFVSKYHKKLDSYKRVT